MPSNCVQDDGGTWSVDHCAVWVEHMRHDGGGTRVAMLRHPSYPLLRTATQPGQGDDPKALFNRLREIANEYIQAIKVKAGIAQAVVDALDSNDKDAFGWLSIAWGGDTADREDTDPDARKSFWVARHDANNPRADRTAVLLAGRRLKDGKGAGGEIGLRVVMQVSVAPPGSPCKVRVTGASISNLPQALEPPAVSAGFTMDVLAKYVDLLRSTFRFGDPPALRGFAPVTGTDPEQFRVFGAGSRKSSSRSYSFAALVGQTADKVLHTSTLALVERASHATAEVYDRDPASRGVAPTMLRRRPTRPAKNLDKFRVGTGRLPTDRDQFGNQIGQRTLKHAWFEVRQNEVGNPTGAAGSVQVVPVGPWPLRSDHLAAVHAYTRGNELFERLLAYGLPPNDYFKLARLPLILRHRAAIRPGAGDGNTVNAQVRPDGNGPSIWDVWAPNKNPELEVNFGAANLWHRHLLANDGGRLRAQPMGLAADPRWAWHEFGHVLNFASFGELEFRFAHSTGDALAAIVCDPDSQLVPRLVERCSTFPWVFLTRRHDRGAALGWCWCGRRNAPRLIETATALRGRRFGYFEEQLLSSSLFRLYRSIGGDTVNHLATRRSASDYVVYLIMRALALLGPEMVVPARTVDQLVSALIDADIGTEQWIVTATWPERDPPRNLSRVGGCVHKVIRWAFEQQGLFATDDPLVTAEGVGKPPHVDVFVANGRPGSTGGYEPVPLEWSSTLPRSWHATANGIDLRNGQVVVTVGNRGDTNARQVRVQVWVLPVGQSIPAEPIPTSTKWKKLDAITAQPQDVGAGATATFNFAAASAGQLLAGQHFVVAEATCAADRSNIDSLTGLPSSVVYAPLIDLIPNDNNLGLRIIGL